jgi:hypothetical protein
MAFLLKLVFALIILALAFGFFRTWQVENSDTQKQFASSTAPTAALDGFYKGSVNTPIKVTWQGKKFNAASSTGINIFEGTDAEQYPFVHGVSVGTTHQVLNISYDLPENPFWVRPVLDELVETAPGKYLGKMTLRIIPGYPFSVGFFTLEK